MGRKTPAKRGASQVEENLKKDEIKAEDEEASSKVKRSKEKKSTEEVDDSTMKADEITTPASSSSSSSSSSKMAVESLPKGSAEEQKAHHMNRCTSCGATEPRQIPVPSFILRAEEAAQQSGNYLQTIEIGRLVFSYRPKVGLATVNSLDDVQRLYMEMQALNTPLGDEARLAAEYREHHMRHLKLVQEHRRETKKEALPWMEGVFEPKGIKHIRGSEPRLFRLAIIPGKQLPNQKGRHGSKFGVIVSVTPDPNTIIEEMKEKYYLTGTRGEHFVEKHRVIASAIYFIVRHGNRQRHTHLLFKVEATSEEEYNKCIAKTIFHIPFEGSFAIQVKNPHSKAKDPRGRNPQVDYPGYLQRLFTGIRKDEVRFAPADPPALLNYSHTQFILQFVTEDLVKNYDEVAAALETEEKEDMEDWEKAEHEKLIHDLYLEQAPQTVTDATHAQQLV